MASVVVIHSDAHRRELLVRACRTRGLDVNGFGRVAEIERWPDGHIVVTDLAHLSGWWERLGASHVLGLVANAAEGEAAVLNGATGWLDDHLSAEAFAEVLAERIRAESLWMQVVAQSAFNEFLETEASALEQFLSEADLEPKTSSPAPRSSVHEEPVRVVEGGPVRNGTAIQSRGHDRRGAALLVGLLVLATIGIGSGVYQQRWAASSPDVRVAATPPSTGDTAPSGAADGVRRTARPPAPRSAAIHRPGAGQGQARRSNAMPARESLSHGVPLADPELPRAMPDAVGTTPPLPLASLPDASSLSGRWVVTTQVESSTVAAYGGLLLGFDLRLQQDGGRITGTGRKIAENGRPIRRTRQTAIAVEGYQDGERLALTFTEAGTRRRSSGTFTLVRASDNELRGRFASDAARSAGTVELRRH